MSLWLALSLLLAASPDGGASKAAECATDDECVVLVNEPDDCCACQPGPPRVLPQREVQRRSRRCAAVGACACPPLEQLQPSPQPTARAPDVRAACRSGRCVAVPAKAKRPAR